VRMLLDMRADVALKDKFGNTPFNDAVRHEKDKVAEFIRTSLPGTRVNLPGCSAAVMMCEAAFDGNLRQITRLVENGINVNDADYDGRTALHLSASEGQLAIVEYLIKAKALVDCKDRFEGTPLEDAVRHERSEVQKFLRNHGCELTTTKTNYSVRLCEYASAGKLGDIKTLLLNGVDVEIGDYDKRTALHLAAANERVSVLDYLLQLDPPINPNLVDRFGGTALDDAKRHGKITATAMLTRAGSKSKDDPALGALIDLQAVKAATHARNVRRPKVDEVIKHSPEHRAFDWIKEKKVGGLDDHFHTLNNSIRKLMLTVQGASMTISHRKVFQRSSSSDSNSTTTTDTGLTVRIGDRSVGAVPAVADIPQFEGSLKAAEAVLDGAQEMKKEVIQLRNMLDSSLDEGTGEGSKECAIWNMAQKSYANEVEALNRELRALLELARICRKLMKEVTKNKTRYGRAGFSETFK